MGYPINTVSEDIYYTKDGKLGYISSSRKGGYGSLDVYRVFLFNKVRIAGKVVDEVRGVPLPGVRIDLQYDSSYLHGYSDIRGDYEMFAPINTPMNVKITKDTLDLLDGDYIVNVFFEDKNENKYNFNIGPVGEEPTAIADYAAPDGVKKININIKNDFNKNSYIAVVPSLHEQVWVDSLNALSEKYRLAQEAQSINDLKSIMEMDSFNILFDFDRYELKIEAKTRLDDFTASDWKSNGKNIQISGHTDGRGSRNYNLKLSLRRAKSVYNYLLAKGISSDNMIIQGYGDTKLADKANNESAHGTNRRVQLKFY